MKKSLFLLCAPFCVCYSLRAQNFSVNVDFYDSLDVDSYQLHFNGDAQFSDSIEVFYSIKTADSIPQLLFSDSVDFTVSEPVFPASFSYNAVAHTFSIDFGEYETPYLILELYSVIASEVREHIYVNVYTFETAENEEE